LYASLYGNSNASKRKREIRKINFMISRNQIFVTVEIIIIVIIVLIVTRTTITTIITLVITIILITIIQIVKEV
jgi:hypothetical protein